GRQPYSSDCTARDNAVVGMAVAVAMARGLTRRDQAGTIGNFWQDLLRGCLYVLLPLALLYALVLVGMGVPQSLSSTLDFVTVEGQPGRLVLGPVASQVAIKMLGTNGGGFYNTNAAHPFENPSAASNFLQMLSIFLLPAGLVHSYGRMTGQVRNGYAILAAMAALFGTAALLALPMEAGVWEGKELRFGTDATALFAVVTTAASCGAVNGMHDSFSALGGMVPLVLIQLGEVVFGGVGAGLYGMLVMVVLTVFLAGLLVGRTPELLGKKVESREITLATLYILVAPLATLLPAALAAVSAWGTGAPGNPGAHGWTEILYAFSSAAGNNGSAFAGLSANTPWWNVLLALSMLAGRFLMLLPALYIGGSLAAKRAVPPSPGTFPTSGLLFSTLLVGVIVIVGALTFFPALALGPIAEATL
ncbi:MAG TPA: potassium-transporting ATPase subunit KdpA, partial [Myxococcota bacterium]|nr:potassium-transporting ATPase subunit KdpA [Myxococcota bacterium]